MKNTLSKENKSSYAHIEKQFKIMGYLVLIGFTVAVILQVVENGF